MASEYRPGDYAWIRELLGYPRALEERLRFFDDTSSIAVPSDPIERVIFQGRAKQAIRKIAQNRGHMLMVGRPGTGKSMLAEMFKEVLDRSIGDLLRPQEAIVAYPGKDKNHVRLAYEHPEKIDRVVEGLRQALETAQNSSDEFSLEEEIGSARAEPPTVDLAAGQTRSANEQGARSPLSGTASSGPFSPPARPGRPGWSGP